jgi:plasmid stabilization system protein ParE
VKPIIRPAARDDILRQFRYYLVDQDKPEVAERFLRAVRKTIEVMIRRSRRRADLFCRAATFGCGERGRGP